MFSERGQMAIFIALFFQVLFVFFAMAINVGLVVHDKINLQTAVDFAAYYGAARQAEILNQIGHINYQMRQNYKLFVWRFHGLGSIGLDIHPLNPRGGGTANFNASYCIAHDLWQEYFNLDPNSSICRTEQINLPNIPQITGIGGIVPGASALVGFVEQTRNQFSQQCNEAGVFNFHFAARMLAHYRVDGAARKRMIFQLADLLTNRGADDFTDLAGNSARTGAERTFRNNLTAANAEGVANFQMFNSMSGACGDRNVWLPEVRINPVIRYTDLDGTNVNAGCVGTGQPNRGNTLPSGRGQFPLDPVLEEHWQGEPTNELHSSIGFEKNPWCMTYVGIRATTQVQKLFSPLGQPVTLEARGFAKPFGGRIGPWYGTTWPSGAARSVNNPKTDPLIPSREGDAAADPNLDIVNYSRYPGDPIGFVNNGQTNREAVAVMQGAAAGILGGGNQPVFAWQQYSHLGHLATFETTGDSLARSETLPAGQAALEQAALAPDAFDITYYSIEPLYYENYFNDNTFNGNPALDPGLRVYDFGSSKDGAEGRQINENVQAQIQEAQGVYQGLAQQFIVNNWQHLLTGWHQTGATDYSFSEALFGVCEQVLPNPNFPTTGNCVVGGRVGYAVKNVSRDLLLSTDNEVGGPGAGGGQILSPPPF